MRNVSEKQNYCIKLPAREGFDTCLIEVSIVTVFISCRARDFQIDQLYFEFYITLMFRIISQRFYLRIVRYNQ